MQKEHMYKGLGMGIVTGIAVGMVGQQMLNKNKKQLRRKANHMVGRIENAIDEANSMIFKNKM